MKTYRVTFETARLDVWDMCVIIKYAQQGDSEFSFSDFNTLMHVHTNTYNVYRNVKEYQSLINNTKQAV